MAKWDDGGAIKVEVEARLAICCAIAQALSDASVQVVEAAALFAAGEQTGRGLAAAGAAGRPPIG
ncbi:hypothetical protein VQ03_03345 [Methylobacterium tarhaniae]|uniref:Uncharacterized protein n=1 Tax=Methylobacterium tarhaniae TaxID=1187852 RepID=A0A0J6TAV1_9HYPH|nr:hypothetical protein VQ03_03345 [Methylobacterium tarhaniae]